MNSVCAVHFSLVVRTLMAWVITRLCRALHVNGAVGGRVINAARIGSSGSCSYTIFGTTGCFILDINGTTPGVLLIVWC